MEDDWEGGGGHRNRRRWETRLNLFSRQKELFFYVLIVTDFGVYWSTGTLSFRRGRDGSQCRVFLRDEI